MGKKGDVEEGHREERKREIEGTGGKKSSEG